LIEEVFFFKSNTKMQTFGFGSLLTDGIEGADHVQNILPGNSNLSLLAFGQAPCVRAHDCSPAHDC
jgi:hypothetical protein